MPDNREIPNGDPRIDQIQRVLQQIAADIGDLRLCQSKLLKSASLTVPRS